MAYIYQADIYCDECGKAIQAEIQKVKPRFFRSDKDYDSDEFPQWCDETQQEADSPQHCGSGSECLNPLDLDGQKYGCFLQNALTGDGMAYVVEHAKDSDNPIAQFWADEYL